jgi:hypothetical protein
MTVDLDIYQWNYFKEKGHIKIYFGTWGCGSSGRVLA